MVGGQFLKRGISDGCKLYVGNLAFSTSEDAVRTLFAQAGTVVSVAIIKDRFTGESKGFGFVEMETQEAAQAAITQFNGYKLDNRDIKVSLARPRERTRRLWWRQRRL